MNIKTAIASTKKLYQSLGWPTIFTHIRFFTAPYEKLEQLIPEKGFIIDLGCGYGIFSNFLGLIGPQRQVLGIELDSGKIKFANRGVANVKFLKADITKITLKKADVILLIHVLHHLNSFQEQEKLLTECKKKLTRNGELIIAEVDKKPILKYILGWIADKLLYPGDKIYYRMPNEFEKLFRNLGFRVKMIKADGGKPFAHVIYILERIKKKEIPRV